MDNCEYRPTKDSSVKGSFLTLTVEANFVHMDCIKHSKTCYSSDNTATLKECLSIYLYAIEENVWNLEPMKIPW